MYQAAKISFDGSHYIATPKENFPQGRRRRNARPPSLEEITQNQQFETAYAESKKLPRRERRDYLRDALKKTIADEARREEFIDRHTERKKTNAIRRKCRLSKKVHLQEWNYFCTFTYSAKAYRGKFCQIPAQYLQTLRESQGMEAYRRMGTRECDKPSALSRDILYPARQHGGRSD